MSSVLAIEWAGEVLELHAAGAIFWKRAATLIVADCHFGKAATFRAAGIPVPPGTTESDICRLDQLIRITHSQRLLFLGDFFHAAPGCAPELPCMQMLATWRERNRELDITLVLGNHDRHAGNPPEEWRFTIIEENLIEPPFLFCHDPNSRSRVCQAGPGAETALMTIAGHIHPAVRLRDITGASIRLPCYHFGKSRALLPAFGSFTGDAVIRPYAGDQVVVITPDGDLISVPTERAHR